MQIALFISFCLISIMIFVVVPKRLHLFEIIFIWSLLTYLKANMYNFVLSLNEEMLIIPKTPHKYGAYIIGSYLLLPVLIGACHNVLRSLHSLIIKLIIIIITAISFVSIESWQVAIHILERKEWSLYHSFLFWLGMILCVTISSEIFRRTLIKEVVI